MLKQRILTSLTGLGFFVSFFSSVLAPAPAHANLTGTTRTIRRAASSAAGGVSTGTTFILNSSVGEPSSVFSGTTRNLLSGHVPVMPQPGTITALTALSRSTGTITLAWTAPGLDGFAGNVTGGSYRIDYSSDAGHVFSPSTYVTEFSTNVSPGDPQAFTLTGLEANTTYFARIYLADSQKTVAGDSAASEESSLANVPVFPSVSGVFSSSVTLSWSLPVGAAEGYDLQASSTNFGTLFPGGTVVSSATENGVVVTMSVIGLTPSTTYYLRVGSLNWQDIPNFTSTVTVHTSPFGGPVPIENLAVAAAPANRTVVFTWNDPAFVNPAGVLVQVSTNPITQGAQNGTAYADGASFPDGSAVDGRSTAGSHLSGNLSLDTTYFYRFYSMDTSNNYSVFTSTWVLLDLPPMAPGGLIGSLNADKSLITLNWASVMTHSDGSFFESTSTPKSLELTSYEIFRSTGLNKPTWVMVDSAPANAGSWTVAVPSPSSVYYYRVDSKDSIGQSDNSMVIDTNLNLYAVGTDNATRLKIPASMASSLQATGNALGTPLFVRAVEESTGEGILKAVRFDAVNAVSGKTIPNHQFPKADMDVVLGYDVSGGEVVASQTAPQGVSAQGVSPQITAGDASQWLTPYWFNGKEYVKLFGDVNTAAQTVTVKSALTGSYQIRSVFRPLQFTFDIAQISNKVITPNGDGLNDFVVFRFNNPQASSVAGQVFDVRGAKIADMTAGSQVAGSLVWDGKSGGRAVPRGVYVYQIEAEGKTFNGTIVVIR